MTPVDGVRRWLADYFAAKDPGLVSDDGTRVDARRLLIDAIRVHGDGEVAIDAKLIGLAALLFWCRWLETPTDHHDPDCQSAYRLYRVLLTVDEAAQVPPQLVGPLADPANDEPVPALLQHEARDLTDGCLRQFDDTAVGPRHLAGKVRGCPHRSGHRRAGRVLVQPGCGAVGPVPAQRRRSGPQRSGRGVPYRGEVRLG
ncbi:hypothetical protein EYA84_01285 [Verrucosispora sp. SN26_14.1]|uniref:hypothetical protein n=1 Tax=Verrucosispora sp. SN26_14.1 TaxID=2527879 RepID=UPI001034C94C|nr:hypothetical protein [Verrucosispora sp. SN26_14.1]TBL44916.1 hypothetical protein EYA84_01285 [Verrucosispora sp. SN26_14.1]